MANKLSLMGEVVARMRCGKSGGVRFAHDREKWEKKECKNQ